MYFDIFCQYNSKNLKFINSNSKLFYCFYLLSKNRVKRGHVEIIFLSHIKQQQHAKSLCSKSLLNFSLSHKRIFTLIFMFRESRLEKMFSVNIFITDGGCCCCRQKIIFRPNSVCLQTLVDSDGFLSRSFVCAS